MKRRRSAVFAYQADGSPAPAAEDEVQLLSLLDEKTLLAGFRSQQQVHEQQQQQQDKEEKKDGGTNGLAWPWERVHARLCAAVTELDLLAFFLGAAGDEGSFVRESVQPLEASPEERLALLALRRAQKLQALQGARDVLRAAAGRLRGVADRAKNFYGDVLAIRREFRLFAHAGASVVSDERQAQQSQQRYGSKFKIREIPALCVDLNFPTGLPEAAGIPASKVVCQLLQGPDGHVTVQPCLLVPPAGGASGPAALTPIPNKPLHIFHVGRATAGGAGSARRVVSLAALAAPGGSGVRQLRAAFLSAVCEAIVQTRLSSADLDRRLLFRVETIGRKKVVVHCETGRHLVVRLQAVGDVAAVVSSSHDIDRPNDDDEDAQELAENADGTGALGAAMEVLLLQMFADRLAAAVTPQNFGAPPSLPLQAIPASSLGAKLEPAAAPESNNSNNVTPNNNSNSNSNSNSKNGAFGAHHSWAVLQALLRTKSQRQNDDERLASAFIGVRREGGARRVAMPGETAATGLPAPARSHIVQLALADKFGSLVRMVLQVADGAARCLSCPGLRVRHSVAAGAPLTATCSVSLDDEVVQQFTVREATITGLGGHTCPPDADELHRLLLAALCAHVARRMAQWAAAKLQPSEDGSAAGNVLGAGHVRVGAHEFMLRGEGVRRLSTQMVVTVLGSSTSFVTLPWGSVGCAASRLEQRFAWLVANAPRLVAGQ